MNIILPLLCGLLFGLSAYLLLRRDVVRTFIGIAVLGNASNLTIFTLGKVTRGVSPIIPQDVEVIDTAFANPLPQALILTAIVIGFGVLAFALVLVYRSYQEMGTLDVDRMRFAEPLYEGESLPAEAGEA